MGVLFDSLAAAGAGLLSVFLAFGNVVQDTHSLLEATSHICLQSCNASRGLDGERAALGTLTPKMLSLTSEKVEERVGDHLAGRLGDRSLGKTRRSCSKRRSP